MLHQIVPDFSLLLSADEIMYLDRGFITAFSQLSAQPENDAANQNIKESKQEAKAKQC